MGQLLPKHLRKKALRATQAVALGGALVLGGCFMEDPETDCIMDEPNGHCPEQCTPQDDADCCKQASCEYDQRRLRCACAIIGPFRPPEMPA